MVYVYRVRDGLDVPGVRKTMGGMYRVMDGDQHWKSEKAPHSGWRGGNRHESFWFFPRKIDTIHWPEHGHSEGSLRTLWLLAPGLVDRREGQRNIRMKGGFNFGCVVFEFLVGWFGKMFISTRINWITGVWRGLQIQTKVDVAHQVYWCSDRKWHHLGTPWEQVIPLFLCTDSSDLANTHDVITNTLTNK